MARFMTSMVALLLIVTVWSVYDHHDRFPAVLAQSEIKVGEKLYLENCAACHGQKGDGKGPEANRLKTKPRDFTTGNYKFRSTPSGSLPLDDDIFRSISRGVRTTSMLAQLHLSEEERWAVTRYIKTFSERFKSEKPRKPISIPAKPSFNAKLVALGKVTYEEAGCGQCHGPRGRGDGPSANELKDESGNSIIPTDLTLKPFKSGSNPQDLYRTVSTGLNGTPMPSYAEALAPGERWAVVSYLLSIATRDRPRGMMGLIEEESEGMRIDMQAAMAGMMGGRGMMGRGGGMMDRNMRDMMKDMMGR
ncbi:MAG: cytochrome c [Deltaproteobacteria bacterium]|nr:cytochrome c [Deltaproteobacteria bacterium]MDZ4340983.1 cytochrome c [Candidatus Binatia bacterium]